MVKLTVLLTGTDHTGAEAELTRTTSDRYDLDQVEALIRLCLSKANTDAARTRGIGNLEVGVWLSADEADSCRPSLHLSADTIKQLSEAGASFDFDPYVHGDD